MKNAVKDRKNKEDTQASPYFTRRATQKPEDIEFATRVVQNWGALISWILASMRKRDIREKKRARAGDARMGGLDRSF
jgi:hypothetical protein